MKLHNGALTAIESVARYRIATSPNAMSPQFILKRVDKARRARRAGGTLVPMET